MAHRVAEQTDVDLDDIWLYIAKQTASVEIADSVVDSITDSCVTLGRNPYMGRRREDLGPHLRSFPAGSYIIVYSIDGEDVSILHVFHGSRDIESFFRH